jgi:DNA-binding response OmpR family regulator
METLQVGIRDVLCVEPDAASRALLQKALSGFSVVFAIDGFEAAREVNRRAFHAYILEYWVPLWSGTDACKEIRKVDPRVPVLFSTTAGDAHRARAIRAGASAFLQKPIDPPVLRRKLNILLELAELESRRAHVDELLAIDEELQQRAAGAIARTGLAKLTAARAIERSARLKAAARYVASGGTMAHFEHAWSSTFARRWASYDQPQKP